VSFVPKRKKAVILVSSMHDSGVMDEATKKPEIILDYNMTKGGMDTCDKMCALYSVLHVTRRWRLAVFYILMNIAGVNSWVIYTVRLLSFKTGIIKNIFMKEMTLLLFSFQHTSLLTVHICMVIQL